MDELGSRHRNRHGQLMTVARRWHPIHLDAYYHRHEWGEHAHAEHELLGEHETPAGAASVAYVEDAPAGAGGPEFRVVLPTGSVLTCLCADTVRDVLERNTGYRPA